MPYVEVWVDEIEVESEIAGKLRDAIQEALCALRAGEPTSAERTLGLAIDCKITKNKEQKDRELSDLMTQWQNTYGPRQDFLTFAHSKRVSTCA